MDKSARVQALSLDRKARFAFGSRQLRASQHLGSADPSSRDGAAKYKEPQHFNFGVSFLHVRGLLAARCSHWAKCCRAMVLPLIVRLAQEAGMSGAIWKGPRSCQDSQW